MTALLAVCTCGRRTVTVTPAEVYQGTVYCTSCAPPPAVVCCLCAGTHHPLECARSRGLRRRPRKTDGLRRPARKTTG